MDKEKIKQLYSLYSTSLLEFAKYFCEDYLICEIPKFHKEIYELLPKTARLALASPRGFAKSTICSVIYPLWLAVFAKRKDICIISASETLATEWLRMIKRELEINKKILYFFGDQQSGKWTETHIILKNGVNIRARGAGGQIRGFRPDCNILDDIETDEGVSSEDQRKKLKEWLNKACINTLLPGGQLVIIGTIIHPLSLLHEILTSKIGWETRKYQAYTDGIQEEGHELWVAMWPHEKLQVRKKEIGAWAFSSEFMNDPINPEDARFKNTWFKYYENLPDKVAYFTTIDPSIGESATSDYSVILTCAVDERNNLYVVHYIRDRLTKGSLINAIFNVFNQYRPQRVGIETVAFQKMLLSDIEAKSRQTGKFLPIEELKADVKRTKEMRVMALQPRFESGAIWFKRDMDELEGELIQFPYGRYDDLVDALAYQLQIITPYYFIETEKTEKQSDREILAERGTCGYGEVY